MWSLGQDFTYIELVCINSLYIYLQTICKLELIYFFTPYTSHVNELKTELDKTLKVCIRLRFLEPSKPFENVIKIYTVVSKILKCKVGLSKNKLIFNCDKHHISLLKTISDYLFHKILISSNKFFNPKNLTGGQIVIKMILSDYKGLNSENLALLALNLGHVKVM